MRKVVFDIETKNIFADVGKNDPALLDISVVGIHDSETDSYIAYTEEELGKLWPILEKTDLLIGYNSDHFDVPLLNKYYPGDLLKIRSLDILKEIRNSIGRRVRLDSVASGTLGTNKSGHGLEATVWWRNGEIEKVKQYCLDDVKITKALYEYVLGNKKLHIKEGGTTIDIPLNFDQYLTTESPVITYTLPFN
ncbi:MAG: ribonuclease H-like domain-containing protein [bacterium]|nr:ribonuclease H-like domain-containing protein [bacterium]